MKTVCARCNAHVAGPINALPPFSHGLCEACGSVALAALPRCGAELRRKDLVLDVCSRPKHSSGAHRGKHGEWISDGRSVQILPTSTAPRGRVSP